MTHKIRLNYARNFRVFLLLAFITSCVRLAQAQRVKQAENSPISILNLNDARFGKASRQIGFNNEGNFVIANVKSILDNTGQITIWNPHTKAVAVKLPLSKWVDNYELVLSPHGKWLATENSRADDSFESVKAYRATVLKASDLKIAKIKNYGARESSGGVLFASGDENYTFIKGVSLVIRNGELDYGDSHLDWLNLSTGKVNRSLPYFATNEVDKFFFSPDRKYLAGLFYSEAFNPHGTSDYAPLRNSLDREGYVDIISPSTGKILWHISPNSKKPVGDPFFFISPTQFVSSDTLFDIPTKTAKPWYAVSATRKCLAAVPGHASYALFTTPQGLELRDWRRKRTLRRWPTLTKPGHILFSPDLKMFSFKRDSTIQFWKFDLKWLK